MKTQSRQIKTDNKNTENQKKGSLRRVYQRVAMSLLWRLQLVYDGSYLVKRAE